MTYNAIAEMTRDPDLRQRLYACAGSEGLPDPQHFIDRRIWEIVANPDFADAYKAASETGVPAPGKDEGVIPDAVILAHVQPLIQPPAPAPEPEAPTETPIETPTEETPV
ncbi:MULTISPECIES: hypothetical protein [unclassified Microbacterium]|uniref:hypothetical protein n=1 Tax=unclassified Microbacterium TaxID=2609290 RepID=UPI00301B6B3D